jgi:tetratricopeptide (TPR) repeat protein
LDKQFTGFHWRWKTRLLASWGELHLLHGDARAALQHAEGCLELAEGTSSRKSLVEGWKLKGEALADLGRLDEAASWLEEAIDMAEMMGNPPLIWKSRYGLGQVLEHLGRIDLAQQQYDQAALVVEDTFSNLQAPKLVAAFLTAEPVRAVLTATSWSS